VELQANGHHNAQQDMTCNGMFIKQRDYFPGSTNSNFASNTQEQQTQTNGTQGDAETI